jgi:hypothetical protein
MRLMRCNRRKPDAILDGVCWLNNVEDCRGA